jgi:hypothetical protein
VRSKDGGSPLLLSLTTCLDRLLSVRMFTFDAGACTAYGRPVALPSSLLEALFPCPGAFGMRAEASRLSLGDVRMCPEEVSTQATRSQGTFLQVSMRFRGGGCAPSRAESPPSAPLDVSDDAPRILGGSERPRDPVALTSKGALLRNSATDSAQLLRVLSKLDDRLIDRLDAGDIRILRASWLCQPSVARLARRQDLEQLERGGDSPFLRANEATDLLRRGGRCLGALTYGWLLPGDPDPAGARLDALRAALAQHPHIAGVFWDYGSLHQVPLLHACPW